MTKQVRFWTYHCPAGHPVQIKLRAGETVSHSHLEITDEGYNTEFRTWSFDGEHLTLRFVSDGRDCDGRLMRFTESFCTADSVRAGFDDPDSGVKYPAWQRVSAGQRDYSAEAAGY